MSTDHDGTVLTVANDGPAIPEEERERIFEPFMRLDEARSLDIGGSGLGLAIARSIMTALGGSIVCCGGRSRSGVQGVVPGAAPQAHHRRERGGDAFLGEV